MKPILIRGLHIFSRHSLYLSGHTNFTGESDANALYFTASSGCCYVYFF